MANFRLHADKTEKTALATNDVFLIEDSEDSYNTKYVLQKNLLGGFARILKPDGSGSPALRIGNDEINKFGVIEYDDTSDQFYIQGGAWGGVTRDIILQGGGGNTYIGGYTQLGSDAPVIKMKKITGTTASTVGGTANITHGLNRAKFICYSSIVLSTFQQNQTYVPNYQYQMHAAEAVFSVTNDISNSAGMLSAYIVITVWYEE